MWSILVLEFSGQLSLARTESLTTGDNFCQGAGNYIGLPVMVGDGGGQQGTAWDGRGRQRTIEDDGGQQGTVGEELFGMEEW